MKELYNCPVTYLTGCRRFLLSFLLSVTATPTSRDLGKLHLINMCCIGRQTTPLRPKTSRGRRLHFDPDPTQFRGHALYPLTALEGGCYIVALVSVVSHRLTSMGGVGGRGRGDDGFMMISFRAPVDFLAVDEVS